MNKSSDREPTLSENQMDKLLTAFYQSEVPDKLDQLPSTWPQIADSKAPEPVRISPVPNQPIRSGSAGRGLAVAITVAAVCLMVVVFSQPPGDTATADNKPEAVLDDGNTATVSGSGGQTGTDGAARDDETSWNEVLNGEAPKKHPGKKAAASEDK